LGYEEGECVDGDEAADVDDAVDPGLVVPEGLADEFGRVVRGEVRGVVFDALEEAGAFGVGEEFGVFGELRGGC
jgi:hypothetical protein